MTDDELTKLIARANAQADAARASGAPAQADEGWRAHYTAPTIPSEIKLAVEALYVSDNLGADAALKLIYEKDGDLTPFSDGIAARKARIEADAVAEAKRKYAASPEGLRATETQLIANEKAADADYELAASFLKRSAGFDEASLANLPGGKAEAVRLWMQSGGQS